MPSVQLDRELVDTYYVSVDAIDGGGLRTSTQVIIKLNDLNDNAPQFVSNLLSIASQTTQANYLNTTSNNILVGFIDENSFAWTEPIRLQAFDRDAGLNGMVAYNIIDGDYFLDYFTIINNSIALKENKSIDFEKLYKLRHSADNANKSGSLKIIESVLHSPLAAVTSLMNPGEVDLNLLVMAYDLGSPSLNTKILVKVIVKVR
jgi:hypothetical protein